MLVRQCQTSFPAGDNRKNGILSSPDASPSPPSSTPDISRAKGEVTKGRLFAYGEANSSCRRYELYDDLVKRSRWNLEKKQGVAWLKQPLVNKPLPRGFRANRIIIIGAPTIDVFDPRAADRGV